MTIVPRTAPNYICPICLTPLQKSENSLTCDNAHNFDFAKEGYVNLLPVQLKKSLNPGDDKNMVLARREFLTSGHYQFLRDKIITLLTQFSPSTIIDLGCGEGYYTNEIETALSAEAVYGVDISKSAVKYAAKRNNKVHYSVATISHLPFGDKTTNAIVNVFAPLVATECRRILAEDGKIIRVTPGPRHLWQLKQFVYETPQLHDEPKPLGDFILIDQITVTETRTVNKRDIEHLLLMTPFGWKIQPDKLQQLKQNEELNIEFEFLIDTYQ
ncbi:methyltransferase domain-containing protein [Psychrosphaera sp. B3R10]|uniref:putative RNA methyltransferase n=1 Tax=unclassified Psychrosphaera TaxID=2641570 RepID=UPI001C08439C|nr:MULTISPECIES: methyltransferase domain-containing protein [unclassified Psychrosphaera]MBU2882833.1 methyltransferase domain-containing protein [Psychrosphaera sp. I2R16]MBU2990428.1 methyltransferase domain-containing protein [Psychrosphaera sp. B3R10]